MAFLLRVTIAIAMFLCSFVALRAQQPDFNEYRRAADYCRGNVARPIALSPDKRIVCFDGNVSGYDYRMLENFEQGGLFVVRSLGGDGWIGQWLGDYLRRSQAIVVVYDYCMSACADYLLIASEQTFILKDTLVAWHDFVHIHYCPVLVEARDGGPKRFRKVPCADAPPEMASNSIAYEHADYRFFKSRLKDPEFEMPPESVAVRRRLHELVDGSATCPIDVVWMWHPRYYAATFKTKIFYEEYPGNQHEVDALASKLRLHVIYDP
jgi:hypothetical protein